MPDAPGSLMRRAPRGARLMLVILVWLAWAAPAAAQQPGPQPLAAPSDAPEFLTRYDFQLSGVALAIDDKRFSWDTHFGGALDVIDYGIGRASIVADYEAVLGDELRAFDPNQARYTLETSCSAWAGATEIAFVLHHVSRHLSDRPNRTAIAWNVLGARVMRKLSVGGTTLAVRAGAGRLIAHALVDYSWTADLDVVVRHRFNERVGLYARGSGEVFSIDAASSNRNTQESGRLEGGVRVNGRAAAMELFAGYERRADADPFERLPLHWALAGFRLVNK
jgi:hypothetical protein